MNRKVDLSISCYGEVKDGRYDIVALPWGATEPHNLHLPYMTDCILSHDVAVSAALIAKQKYGVGHATYRHGVAKSGTTGTSVLYPYAL